VKRIARKTLGSIILTACFVTFMAAVCDFDWGFALRVTGVFAGIAAFVGLAALGCWLVSDE
jgi:hypothetical protein